MPSVKLEMTFSCLAELDEFVSKHVPVATENTKKVQTFNEKLIAREEKVEQANSATTEEKTEIVPSEVRFEYVKNAILKVSKDKSRDAAVAVLDKFGYKKVSAEMKTSDYAAIVAECNTVLAS